MREPEEWLQSKADESQGLVAMFEFTLDSEFDRDHELSNLSNL